MNEDRIFVSPSALELFKRLWGQDPQAFHLVWEHLGEFKGRWTVAFSPETQVLANTEETAVAGQVHGILIVLDGPIVRPARDYRIAIDTTPDGGFFVVGVSDV